MTPVHRTDSTLADGREITWFDTAAGRRPAPDGRDLAAFAAGSQLRADPLTGEWVAMAGHRQTRTFMPPADECPLCPSRPGRPTEIPSAEYEVVAFANRFPSFSARSAELFGDEHPDPQADPAMEVTRPGAGACEVVCFTSDHDTSFAQLTPQRVRLVVDVWAQRTQELGGRAGVEYVFPFENRGAEIGVTLQHPHGQIYAYPFVPQVATRELDSADRHRAQTGRNLFADIIDAEQRAGVRVVAQTAEWIAFVPFAARWPVEVHLYPLRRSPDLPGLDDAQRDDFARIYLDVLGRFDRLYSTPMPYIAAWQQAPARSRREEAWVHLELLSIRRSEGKIKYLAGSESGQGAWVNDGQPEEVARRLREAGE